MSNVRRPTTTAPVAMSSSKPCPLGPSCGRYPETPPRPSPSQSCSRCPPAPRPCPARSSGPAMKPSSDIDMYRTDLDIRSPFSGLAQHGSLQPRERVGQADAVLVAQRLGREPGLDHGHQGRLATGLERELEARQEARPFEPRLGGREADPARAIDLFEDVAMVVELGSSGAEGDRPDAADAQLAARLADPSRRVLAVELPLTLGAREGVEDLVGPGADEALEPQVPAHASPPAV